MKISVVTVNYNGNAHLFEALHSILSQDHKELELLVIDGGSDDGSLDTLQKVAEGDSRVQWISEPDNGIADAMNKGLAKAAGEVIAFLHSDDRYSGPQTLSTVAAEFGAHPEALWVTGGLEMMGHTGSIFRYFPPRNYSKARLVRSNILFHPSTFVRTETLRRVGGFNPQLRLAMDYDLWLRLAELAPPQVLSKPLASFRVHQGSRSIQAASAAMDEEFQIRCQHLKAQGRQVWPYHIHYRIKRLLNGLFVSRLQRQGKRES